MNLEGILNSNQPWRRLSCALCCLWGPEQLLSIPPDANSFPLWLGDYGGFSVGNPHIWEDHTQDGIGHTSRSQVQFKACSDQISLCQSFFRGLAFMTSMGLNLISLKKKKVSYFQLPLSQAGTGSLLPSSSFPLSVPPSLSFTVSDGR